MSNIFLSRQVAKQKHSFKPNHLTGKKTLASILPVPLLIGWHQCHVPAHHDVARCTYKKISQKYILRILSFYLYLLTIMWLHKKIFHKQMLPIFSSSTVPLKDINYSHGGGPNLRQAGKLSRLDRWRSWMDGIKVFGVTLSDLDSE